jgi:hypothetical protein
MNTEILLIPRPYNHSQEGDVSFVLFFTAVDEDELRRWLEHLYGVMIKITSACGQIHFKFCVISFQ